MSSSFEIRTSPCANQTEADIERYYRNAPDGAKAVVRRTQARLLEYSLCQIEDRNARSGRVYVTDKIDVAFYMKHGRSCWHPSGQTTLVVPTQAVLDWIEHHPGPEMGVTTFPRDENGRTVDALGEAAAVEVALLSAAGRPC